MNELILEPREATKRRFERLLPIFEYFEYTECVDIQFAPTPAEVEALRPLSKAFLNGLVPARPRLIASDNSSIELSASLAAILRRIVLDLNAGKTVTVVTTDAHLTTQQAADLLGVSRPTLIGLLTKFSIPVHTVGRHRRIEVSDFQVLQQRFKQQQVEKLRAMADLSAEMGEHETDFSNPLVR